MKYTDDQILAAVRVAIAEGRDASSQRFNISKTNIYSWCKHLGVKLPSTLVVRRDWEALKTRLKTGL